jgi:hypothetical protein
MNPLLSVNKLMKYLIVGVLLTLNFGSDSAVVIASDSHQSPQPILQMVENISFDPSGKLLRLTGQENNINSGPNANPHLFGVYSGIAADDSYAYIVNHVFFEGADNVGLWIVDFFDPEGPVLLGFVNIQLANDIFVRGEYAYVVSGMGQWVNLLTIVDVSDPTSPQIVSTVGLSAPGMDVFVEGDYAYVAMGTFGMGIFKVINISNPAAPYIVGSYYNGYGSASALEHEGIAYLADEYALITLNVSEPGSPQLISEFEIGLDDATSVRLKENIIYMTTEKSSTEGGLFIIDMNSPAAPNLLKAYNMPAGKANDLLLLGNYGFIANDVAGLRFMDLSDLYNPVSLDLFDTSGTALDLALAGSNLYLADSSSVYMFNLNLYSVSGRVVDASGNPLNNFPVSAGSYSHNITDITGQYTLGGLYEGDYLINANKDGYHSLTSDVPVHVPPNTAAPDLIMEANAIKGQVLSANRLPIGGIRIDSSNGYYSVSDENGRYKISELTEQTYTIVPTDTNWIFQPSSITFTVPPYNHKQNFWIMPPPQTIELIPGTPAQIIYQEFQGTNTIIQFPQDAVTQTTTLVLTPQIVQGSWGNKFTGHAFDITAYQGDLQLPEFTFNSPILVTIEYSDYDLRAVIDEELLNLQTYQGSDWSEASLTCDPPLPYSYDLELNVIGIFICQTGRYGLFGPTHQVLVPTVLHAP